MKIKEILSSIPKLSQVQYSTVDQLYQLVKISDKLELVVAKHYIENICKGHKIFAYDCLVTSVIEKWEKVEKENVHYDSLNRQLSELIPFAVKFGLYDAADFIKDSL